MSTRRSDIIKTVAGSLRDANKLVFLALMRSRDGESISNIGVIRNIVENAQHRGLGAGELALWWKKSTVQL